MTHALRRIGISRLALLLATLVLSLGLIATTQAQQLKGKSKTVRYDGCCTHCSSTVCSGCSSSVTGICGVGAFKANCSTLNDQTHCVPAKTLSKKNVKTK